MEEQYIYDALFVCRKCSGVVRVSRENDSRLGTCQNAKCGFVKDYSLEADVVKNTQKLFSSAITILERGEREKSLNVLKECLRKRQKVLHRFDKDVAETHDALSR